MGEYVSVYLILSTTENLMNRLISGGYDLLSMVSSESTENKTSSISIMASVSLQGLNWCRFSIETMIYPISY